MISGYRILAICRPLYLQEWSHLLYLQSLHLRSACAPLCPSCRPVFSDRQRPGITGSTAFQYRDFRSAHRPSALRHSRRPAASGMVTTGVASTTPSPSVSASGSQVSTVKSVGWPRPLVFTCRVCDFPQFTEYCGHLPSLYPPEWSQPRFTCSHFICGQRVLHRVRRAVRFSDRQRQGITGSTAFPGTVTSVCHTVPSALRHSAVCCFRNGYYRCCCICCTITIRYPRDLGIGSKISHIPGFAGFTALSQTDTDAVLPVNHRILRNIHGYFTGSHFIFSHGMRHVLRGLSGRVTVSVITAPSAVPAGNVTSAANHPSAHRHWRNRPATSGMLRTGASATHHQF